MMVGALILTLAAAPALAVIGCMAARRPRAAEALNLIASAVSFACAMPLPFLINGQQLQFWNDYIMIDRMSAWVVLCTSIVYFLASIYAVGYMRLLNEDKRLCTFYALFAGFGLTTLIGPLMNSVGIYWIAIELTTLVSTFLIAFERVAESMEAAWKYIMVVSAGISLALLGTILFYWGGSFVLGPSYKMTWATLTDAAPQMNPALLKLAFLLVLVGYGTKVGLAPMHSWLPDAHSESPAPVSAMLSGALLNTAMIGIVRFLGVTKAANLGWLPQCTLVAFGIVSLFLGALFIVRQQGIKRLMAYSSIEHMGVVALGFGFGGDALLGQQRHELAVLEHLGDDVAAADQLAADEQLGDGGPLRERAQLLADAGIGQDVDRGEARVERLQDADRAGGEAARGRFRRALHEQDDFVACDRVGDRLADRVVVLIGHGLLRG